MYITYLNTKDNHSLHMNHFPYLYIFRLERLKEIEDRDEADIDDDDPNVSLTCQLVFIDVFIDVVVKYKCNFF
jgi:hypothetical protein